MPISIRARMFGVFTSQEAAPKHEHVDMCFVEQGNPIVLGIRIVGNDTDNRIEAACIGVLSYDDESRRTVADVICV